MTKLVVSLALNIEEIMRLISRQKLRYQNWEPYPVFILGCDFLLSLALLLTTLLYVYIQNSVYAWAVAHVATGASCGYVSFDTSFGDTRLNQVEVYNFCCPFTAVLLVISSLGL